MDLNVFCDDNKMATVVIW